MELFSHHFTVGAVMFIWLLPIFFACALATFLLCGLAKVLFPRFRSGELKPGTHRPDLPAGGREIKTYELPMVGGPALIIAIVGIGIGAAYFLQFDRTRWTLLAIGLFAAVGYGLVGFVDDWKKVYNNEGLSEKVKFSGIFLTSVTVAVLYFFLLPSAGQEPYGFWKQAPILSALFTPVFCSHPGASPCLVSLTKGPVAYISWLLFLMLMTGVFGTLTSLSVDFSDGLDGLAGGLIFSAALGFGIVVAGLWTKPEGIVLELFALLTAAGALGFLPWNWPSAWAARKGIAPRRARIYMGDSGSLGMGGLIAIVAILSRNETLLLIIGGAFVLEGLSALISARVFTPFFRRNLQVLRFANRKEFVPHTEFPLPFLATPLHHHFDLLGWDRRRLVYGAWALGACFAFLGASSTIVSFSWERYVIRILALILAVAVWSSGSWSKSYFVGVHPAEKARRRRLALYYGFPYIIMGIRLYHLVEVIEASEDFIETPAEDIALWQRMSIFDARSMLGLYCYRAGYFPAALAQWTRIPERNRVLRPEISRLLAEVDARLAVEKQETQPMRRDEILRRQQEVVISGKLPLADLPNPYEPVSRHEAGADEDEDWSDLDEEDEENGIPTTSLRRDDTNHYRHLPKAEENGHSPLSPDSSSSSSESTATQSWLNRLRRTSSQK
jgi:UDP-N-acetylmuramyl pentapeptide phosphotransferase/UDP-N-acetylglucosamine-1-phosphate transferase